MPKRKSKPPKARPAVAPVIWNGSDDLRTLLVPIEALLPDPKNARVHGPKNCQRIGKSLKAFGQQKPVVVDDKGIITAGNGTWQEARKLGWTHIARVRTQLSGAMATAYGLADNVSAESAGWDPDQFHANIDELEGADLELEDLGLDLDDEELHEMLGDLSDLPPARKPKATAKASASNGELPDKFGVIVYLPDEPAQTAFIEEMESRKLDHRSL